MDGYGKLRSAERVNQLGVGCFLAALDPRRIIHNCESVLKISGLWFARGVCERCE
jgi:hypothetical protein